MTPVTGIFRGKWALVTGASSGIGAAFARELAADGAKLILTARRVERLEALAAELAASGTTVRTLQADLTRAEDITSLYEATEGEGMSVDILINNAGMGQYGEFCQGDLSQELAQIRLNCEAVVHLSRLFVPRMVERRRGWMLLTASTASFQPMPYLGTYAATKAFDRYFALALAEEVARHGIRVTALCPGRTESEFFEVAHAARFRDGLQSAAEVARRGLNGLARGERTVIPYFGGRAIQMASRLLPVGWITWLIERGARPSDSGKGKS